VDSGSTDATEAVCRQHAQVEVMSRPFDDHTSQWNFGLAQVAAPWVLSLDADYVLTPDLIAELTRLPDEPPVSGYAARFRYCVLGRPLRASLYPSRVVLFRRDRATYRQDGHTQRLQLTGACGSLQGMILHDDRKPIDRWLADQLRYSSDEARHLTMTPPAALSRVDRARQRIVLAPMLVLLYTLFGRGLILDGWPGWYYALQRTLAELLLSLRLVDLKLRPDAAERST
jgi:hypothetical protein